MSSTFTTGKSRLEKPAIGDYVDTWATPVNGNADSVDACFSATVSIGVTSGTTTLSQANMRCQRIVVTGTLTGNVNLNFFAGVPGVYVCSNAVTANSFSVTLGQNAGTSVVLANNLHTLVFCDGTNVVNADAGSLVQGIAPGALQDFAMSTAPSGWLVCDGSAVSRATYGALFANIGTVWGAGNGSSTFNLPALYGQFRRTWDQSGIIDPGRAFASAQTDAFASHNHTVNDSGHSHTIAVTTGLILSGTVGVTAGTVGSSNTSTSTTGISLNATGGSETRPKNYAVLTCIKT